LRVGDRWEQQLWKALGNSRSIVVLWSDKAKTGWARDEFTRFSALVDKTGNGVEPGRAIIGVFLEGEFELLSRYQAIYDLAKAGGYTGGAEQVEPLLWRKIVDRTLTALDGARDSDGAIPVHVAILAMTREQLERLDPDEENVFGSLSKVLHEMAGSTKDDLRQRYDARRTAWRPFGSSEDIVTILGRAEGRINARFSDLGLGGTRFRFQYLDEADFWSANLDDFKYEKRRLLAGWSVVVIDPLSLFQRFVYQRINLLHECFENPRAVVLAFAPFAMPGPLRELRKLIEAGAAPIYSNYFEPRFPRRFAYCGPDVCDELDLKRWLLTALAPQATASLPAARPPYLRQ
jgi:hypothetical protein